MNGSASPANWIIWSGNIPAPRAMSLHLLPYHTNLLAAAAAHVIERAGAALPDLSDVVILVADTLAAAPLRAQCLEAAAAVGHNALLGLRICTLREWIEARVVDTQAPLNPAARRLLLVEALREHQGLFGDDDPWRVADSLLQLFDDLSRYHSRLPDDAQTLAAQMAQAYGIDGAMPAALTREAQIVHRLWQAWQTQTSALQQPDPWAHYLDKLRQDCARPQPDEPFFILTGQPDFVPAELAWLEQRLQNGRAEVLLHGNPAARQTPADAPLAVFSAYDTATRGTATQDTATQTLPATALAECLDAVYPTGQDNLRERAARLAGRFHASPLQEHISTLSADSAEQEAHAIELQVRRWLLNGKRRIGIVTEDRRLARRVRALLERAGILLQDSGGWALSTTSAAACVERWLESVEEDFAHQPLLDFLKSPFLYDETQRETHLALVYRLEHDIIQHENIARGLQRYHTHLDYRCQRLAWPAEPVAALHALLDRIGQAAQTLLQLQHGRHGAQHYLDSLRASLTALGVWQRLEADAAGLLLTRLWDQLNAAARGTPAQLQWSEFRIWLGRALEETSFRPSLANGPVQLLNLAQSTLFHFDALIVGACDREHLPGADPATPFFNTGVRRELGLPTWEQRLALKLYRFRRLLEAAPRVLLSWHREEQGEPLLQSPWLEALQSLQHLSYGSTLEDMELKALLQQRSSSVAAPEPAPLPQPPCQPRPSLPADLLPATQSASSHQHLIDCPYLYFAADCLRLSPPEAVRELLQKSDYGERVHLCLQCFHGTVAGYPGPFAAICTQDNRAAAIALLEKIALAVFARDLEDNFQHRGWLKRWQQLIPSYIDWQIERARDWRVDAVETRVETPFSPALALTGRLDRIDQANDPQGVQAIIDYKTGGVPAQADIDSGEAVQLPIYALLAGARVEQVEYLKLDGPRVRITGGLDADSLPPLRDAVAERLAMTQSALAAGQAMPAWGDPDTCRYCSMDGICRRQAWAADQHG